MRTVISILTSAADIISPIRVKYFQTWTYNRVTEAATALSVEVSKEGEDIEGEECEPDGGARHEVLEPKLTGISNCKGRDDIPVLFHDKPKEIMSSQSLSF